MKQLLILIVLVAFFLPGISIADTDATIPQFPHIFYGNVTGALDGAVVDARGIGVSNPAASNPITVTNGTYGTPGLMTQKLIVQGNIPEGTSIAFYVDNVLAGYATFQSGGVTNLNLTPGSVTPIPTPTPTVTATTTTPTGYSGTGGVGGSSHSFTPNPANQTATPTPTVTVIPVTTTPQQIAVTATPTQPKTIPTPVILGAGEPGEFDATRFVTYLGLAGAIILVCVILVLWWYRRKDGE